MDLLEIKDLHISFRQDGQDQEVIRGIDFTVPPNSIVGIVGESGSGKTVTAMSILQLLGHNPPKVTGKILWNESGQQIDLSRLTEEQIRPYRGAKISVIFQEPMSSLNPVLSCGFQASEGLRVHKLVPRAEIKSEVLRGFQKVGLQDPERVYHAYPFELSGGQLQRVLIALSILCKPKLIIADEPTTALDASLQKHILLLLKQLKEELGVSILFISHDLGMVRELCDYTLVMHKGLIVEKGPTQQLFDSPVHAYTKG
ncbi:MAG TPA: ABC transporter ATP-binding protein, partial [Saprospiraceae bacterium]|nr:ABC transporter ATP-binding protein [Saprospiraceae bacterium]